MLSQAIINRDQQFIFSDWNFFSSIWRFQELNQLSLHIEHVHCSLSLFINSYPQRYKFGNLSPLHEIRHIYAVNILLKHKTCLHSREKDNISAHQANRCLSCKEIILNPIQQRKWKVNRTWQLLIIPIPISFFSYRVYQRIKLLNQCQNTHVYEYVYVSRALIFC